MAKRQEVAYVCAEHPARTWAEGVCKVRRDGGPQRTPKWAKCYHLDTQCVSLRIRAANARRPVYLERLTVAAAEARGWRPCAWCAGGEPESPTRGRSGGTSS